MEIFLGSSSSAESLNDLRKIAILIESEGKTPYAWNKAGVFPLGNYMLDSLIEISKRVEAAILIFNEDDPIWYRNDWVLQPRANVLIEYGIFVAALGKERTIICRRGNSHVASDLQGLIYCDLDKEYRAENEILEWLRFINKRK
ncbi:nucleotide-binding protein [Paenibacillaceae sp. P-4]|uniref:nucleotide-binding protein n=1 Tax=Paenibacillaceae bacterium P-4 TaxID=3160969 RepID=UPI0032E84C8E